MRARTACIAIAAIASAGCVAIHTEEVGRPVWAQPVNASECASVSGTYGDAPVEQRGSSGAVVYRSFGNLLLSRAGSSARPVGIGSSHTTVAIVWIPPNVLQATIFGPHADGIMNIHAKCDGNSVLIENGDAVGIEGGTNHVNENLRLFAVDGHLVAHAVVEIRHTSMGVPMGGFSEQAWYRFSRTAQ